MTLVDDMRTVTAHRIADMSVTLEDGDHGTITLMECDLCHESFEYFFAPYRVCPHCGRAIRVLRS